MKKSLLNAAILVAGMTCAFSCKAQQEEINEPQRIELRSEQDQFLLNFVEATPEGLSLSISREDALYAGATSDGYAPIWSSRSHRSMPITTKLTTTIGSRARNSSNRSPKRTPCITGLMTSTMYWNAISSLRILSTLKTARSS